MKQLIVITITVMVCVVSQVCRADNVAQGKLVSADSQYNTTYVPDEAVDGDVTSSTSRWISNNTGAGVQHWLKVDLDGVYNITSIQVVADYDPQRTDGTTLEVYQTSDATGNAVYSNTVSVSVGRQTNTFNSVEGVTAASIKLSGVGNGSNLVIYELRAFGTPLTNDALNKITTADSEYSSSYPKEQAVDGDANTRWISANVASDHWLQVNLDGMYNIDMVEVRSRYTAASRLNGADLTLYQSTNNWIYSNIVSVLDDSTSPYTSRKLTHNFIMPKGTSASTVKLSLFTNIMDCAELRVYGSPMVNLALNKTATADTYYNNDIQYSPDKAVDGTNTTRWVSKKELTPHWWRVDLGNIYIIKQVQIRIINSLADRINGSTLTLYSSADATGSPVYSSTISDMSADDFIRTFALPAGTEARSVRLSGTGNSVGMMDFAELRVYGMERPKGTELVIK